MQPNEQDFIDVLNFKEKAEKVERLLSIALGIVVFFRDDIIQNHQNPLHALALDHLIGEAAKLGVAPDVPA